MDVNKPIGVPSGWEEAAAWACDCNFQYRLPIILKFYRPFDYVIWVLATPHDWTVLPDE